MIFVRISTMLSTCRMVMPAGRIPNVNRKVEGSVIERGDVKQQKRLRGNRLHGTALFLFESQLSVRPRQRGRMACTRRDLSDEGPRAGTALPLSRLRSQAERTE